MSPFVCNVKVIPIAPVTMGMQCSIMHCRRMMTSAQACNENYLNFLLLYKKNAIVNTKTFQNFKNEGKIDKIQTL